MLKKITGFSLFELLIAIAIVSILFFIAYPSYENYFTNLRRNNVKNIMLNLAVKLEQYYSQHLTYSGASLTDLVIEQENYKSFYVITLKNLTDTEYIIQAQPIGNQKKKDIQCGVLTLNQDAKKTVDGKGDVQACWN